MPCPPPSPRSPGRSRWRVVVPLLLAAAPWLGSAPRTARACELCDGPGSDFVALQEHVERWPLVALGEPVGRTREGRVQFRVTRILKGDANLAPEARVAPPGASAVLPGQVWLLLGRKANFQGGAVLMLRPSTLAFLQAAPRLPPPTRMAERLRTLVPWLQHEDPMVAASARKAFAAAPYADLRGAATAVDADGILRTLADPAIASSSRGPLFLLVGLTGGSAARKRLATWMREPRMQRAPGYDALLAAWITLTGPDGLAPIEALLAAPDTARTVVGGAFVRALGFHARNTDALERERIVAALEPWLRDRDLFPVVVEELGRLEAWRSLEAIHAAYRAHAAEAPWTRGPLLDYLEHHPAPEAQALRARLRAEAAGDDR